jgi:hypothetical protein
MSHERQDGSYPRFLRAVARALPRRAHRRDGRAGDIRSSPPRRRFPPRLQNSSRRWSRAARVPARQCEPQFARDAAIFAGGPPAPTPSSSTRAESRIQTPSGKSVPGTWAAANGQLCLTTGAAQECWPYSQPFQAGQQISLTSSCNSAFRWTALGTNQAAPVQQGAGKRG